jgi:hypothetical protein
MGSGALPFGIRNDNEWTDQRARERAEKSAECGELEASLIHQKKKEKKKEN